MEKIGKALDSSLDQQAVTRECPKHGWYTVQPLLGRAPCPQCVEAQIAEAQEQDRRRFEDERRANRLAAARIPRRYSGASLNDFALENHTAVEAAERFANTVAEGGYAQMVVAGPVGTGKTRFLCALAATLAGREVGALYASASGFLREIRATWDDRSLSEANIYKRYAAQPVLALDDVGAGVELANDVWRLHELIDQRYNDMLPTIFASNLSMKELRDYVGERAYDRMRDDAELVKLLGNSRRAGK